MWSENRDRLVAAIYDAAVDGQLWDRALVTFAEVTGSRQAVLEISDPYSGIVTRHAPLCGAEFKASHKEYWGSKFSLWRRTDRFPIGQQFASADIMDLAAFRRSDFYNEWWLPQGTGGDTRMANVVSDGRATAILAAYRPLANPGFSVEEQELFTIGVQHCIRAVKIHRRLHLAEVRGQFLLSGEAPDGIIVVDAERRILAADQTALLRLQSTGVVSSSGEIGTIDAPNSTLERLIREVSSGVDGALGAGETNYLTADGEKLQVSVLPIRNHFGQELAWLAVDRPIAILLVRAHADISRERRDRLKLAYGLSSAEAAVAWEAAKGDGRAAVADRLGIKEATVKTHLSAVFAKTGVSRQAELVRLVQST